MEMRLPKLGEGADTGTVVSLLVEVGDVIKKDQDIMELENEKAVAAEGQPTVPGRGLQTVSLGQRQDNLTADDSGNQGSFLGVVSGIQHYLSRQHGGCKQGTGRQGPPDFIEEHCLVGEGAAGPAELLRQRYTQPAQSGDLPP